MVYKSSPPFRSGTPPGVRKEVLAPTPRAGFTLVELLAVMSVAAILMLIIVPRVDVERFQLDAAMREVGSAVAAGRGRAILRQHDFVLMSPWRRCRSSRKNS